MEISPSKSASVYNQFIIQRSKLFNNNVTGQNQQLFQKRFPKYINNISFDYTFNNHGLVSKTRQVKKIKAISCQSPNLIKKGLILLIVKRQKRYIRQLNGVEYSVYLHCPYLSQFELNVNKSASWKIFQSSQNLEGLSVKILPNKDLTIHDFTLMQIYSKLRWRFGVQLSILRAVKHLRIEWKEPTEIFALIVLVLLENSGLLDKMKDLKTFAIYAEYPNSEYRTLTHCPVNVLKHVTEFSLGKVALFCPQTFVANLNYCTRLTKLNLFLIEKEHTGVEADLDMGYLSYMRYFANLKDLGIFLNCKSSESFEVFLTSFSLPKAIESITLSIEETKWENLILSSDYSSFKERNPFEELDAYTCFAEQWEGLDNLTVLKVSIEDKSQISSLNEYFLGPLLKRLTKLESLDYKSHCQVNNSKKKICANLSYLWKTLQPSANSLKSLNISDYAVSLKTFDHIVARMPNLEALIINSTMLGGYNLKNFLRCFEKENKNSRGLTSFITEVVIENDESFGHFLEGLSYAPKNSLISIFVGVMKVQPETIFKEILNYIDNVQYDCKVCLQLSSAGKLKTRYWRELNRKVYESQKFQSLLIITTFGKVVVDTRFVPDDEEESEEDDEDDVDEYAHTGFLSMFSKGNINNILEIPE